MVIIFLLSLTFTASLDRIVVSVGESFLVTVSVSGENLSGVGEPSPPSMDKVDIIGTSSSHSTQIQVINGKITRSTSLNYEYQMVALDEGEFTIPSFNLEYKGKKYSTEPIKITVKKTTTKTSIPEVQRETRGTEKESSKKVFLECNISKNSVYLGEPVVVSYYLYTRVNLTDVSLRSLPGYKGVWVENISSPQRLNFEQTLLNGITYSKALIKKDLIFPLKKERIRIEPLTMQITFGGDIFSLFGETKIISTQPKIINVKSFPKAQVQGFIDAVGKFSLSAELDTSESEVGTPFPLKIKIKGEGNLSFLSPLKLPEIRKLKAFKPESKGNTEVKENTIKGERIITYLLAPEEAGVIQIPQINWAYFDPEREVFVRKSIGPWIIRVNPAMKKEKVEKSRSEDIAYIKPVGNKFVPLIPRFFPLYLFLPTIILALSGYYVWERKKILGDSGYARIKSIPAELKRGFQNLKREVEENRVEFFYEELTRLLLKFLKLRFDINTFSMKRDELLGELQNENVSDEVLPWIQQILQKSEEVRFASVFPDKEEMQEDLRRLEEIIRVLH